MFDLSKMRILVVDDTKANIDILLETLAFDYKVSVAMDGVSALEDIRTNLPDLILLDIMMPEMNGYELCQRLKADPSTKNIPIIFVTAKSDESDETKGLELGAVDYITKPFSPPIVRARVKTHLTLEKIRKKVEDAFGRHVHPSVAELILSGRLNTRGTMENVTLLFSDIRDFTGFAEQNHPKQVFARINEYYASMTEVIQNFGGVVLQYVGDEIEAVFGAPFPNEQHPEKAVQSALEMRLALEKLNSKFRESGQTQLNHGIGIHTGPALAGVVGSKERQTYCLVGDTVNVASRVANLCKRFEADILISNQTYDRLIHDYKLIEQPSVLVKGRSEKLIVYQVKETA
ncbi:adenylate/guanylate cyclase domain-containing protein [Desulfobacula sp.]|uniref:adenylate/guanylate cyclase domain-containing protein n=1 Tax=Desulfobacula sp. TaxID=2593537 RepID=UPI0025C05226|nr:adenylate/guanylate cyclase domain-containing protein [Desulfobacula sp.]MBC2703106.1 response regulator [Desulfobacula sp.]